MMFATGSTDIRQLQQSHYRWWVGIKSALQLSLLCIAIAPAVGHGKDGWGCEVGADGKWNCFWSGEGEPPTQQIQTPPAPQRPKPIASPTPVQAQQKVRNGLVVASPVEAPPSEESAKPSIPAAEPETDTTVKSTFGRVKNWFGLGDDEPTEAKGAEPELVQQPVTAPIAEITENIQPVKGPEVPQPKADDVPLVEQTASAEQEEKGDDISTLQRLRGWLGWTSEEEASQVETAQQETQPKPETVIEQPGPVDPPEMQHQPITEDAVISALDTKVKDIENNSVKPDKPSTMGKMKKLLGMSEDKPAKKVETPKPEQQSVIAEIKQYQDFSVSPDLSDLQFSSPNKHTRQSEPDSAGDKPSTTSRFKSWLGFSDKQKPETDKTTATNEGSAKQRSTVIAGSTPPVQIMGIDSDRAVEKEVGRSLPTSMVKPESSANIEKRPSTAEKEKTSWFSKMGSWFGFGGKEKKAEKRDVVTVMPDMKIEDVPAK